MLKHPFRAALTFSVVSVLTLALSLSASAQQAGGATGTDAGGAGVDTGTGAGTGDAGSFGVLDADAIFSGIDRGETVGSTGTTGTGFSVVDAGNGGGRAATTGGIGGLGGGGFGGLGSLFGLGGPGAGGGAQSTRPPLRTRLRSAINVPLTPPSVVQNTVRQSFQTIPNQPQLRGINITMRGKTAVISGVVNTDRDRRMSELLLRLQPGVGSVDNQVVVAPQ